MIEVKVTDHEFVKNIVYSDGKYFITFFKNDLKKVKYNETYSKENMISKGWEKEIAIIDRKLKLEKLLET